MSQSISNTLTTAGFEPIVAEIYLILVNNGELTVPQILEHTELSRASVYEALPELLAGEYIEYRKEGRQAFYKPAHPNQLASLVEQKKRDVALLEGEMGETIRSLVGAYNLSSSKPGVRFFEGREGVYEALDSLANDFTQDDEKIFSFVKVKSSEQVVELNDAVAHFLQKRIEANVHTSVLAIESPEAILLKEQDEKSMRETRLVPSSNSFVDFPGGEILIYKNDICIVTAEGDTYLALIISSPGVSQMFKTLFLSEWSLLS